MSRLLVVGGSDAGISAGLRARQVDPSVEPLLVCGGRSSQLLDRDHGHRDRTRPGRADSERKRRLPGHRRRRPRRSRRPALTPCWPALPMSTLGARDAIAVDRGMRTNIPGVYAAGDCVHTYHRLLDTDLPAARHDGAQQGRVAGENAVGGDRSSPARLGTQVVKVFDLVAARTGLRDHEARAHGFTPVKPAHVADDHKAYYPGAKPITIPSPPIPPAAACSAHNSSGTARPRSPSASTSTLPRSTTHDRRRGRRPRPLVHPAVGQPMGRRPDGHSGLGADAGLTSAA